MLFKVWRYFGGKETLTLRAFQAAVSQAGCCFRWVMSSERHNLELNVTKRGAGSIKAHLAEIISQKQATGKLEPCIIYTISRTDAENITAELQVIVLCM